MYVSRYVFSFKYFICRVLCYLFSDISWLIVLSNIILHLKYVFVCYCNISDMVLTLTNKFHSASLINFWTKKKEMWIFMYNSIKYHGKYLYTSIHDLIWNKFFLFFFYQLILITVFCCHAFSLPCMSNLNSNWIYMKK